MPIDDPSGRAATDGLCMMLSGEANESLELDHHGLVCAPNE